MKRMMLFLMLLCCIIGSSTRASTVAYWRFEAGPADTDVIHVGGTAGVWSADISDVSGNGNDLSVWETGSNAGYQYRSLVAYSVVPQTGVANTLSVKNTGGGPAMWCNTLESWAPAQWTIEATFKLENNAYKTVVGRDSQGSNTAGESPNGDNAALYLQVVPNQALAIKFCDVSGYWHIAQSADNAYVGFDYGSDPDGANAPWYSIAATSDGTLLSLYLLEHGTDMEYQLIAQTDMTVVNPGSPDTALTAGTGDGGDWDAGDWTVGRGLWAGGHTDRAYGFLDEIRISDSALDSSEFLGVIPGPHEPQVDQTADTINGDVDVVLHWKAAADPNGAVNGNGVLPDIAEQYVFMTDGSSDPNLFYIGKLGDPGTSDPNSTYPASGVINLDYDSTYFWAVVEGLDGYTQTLTVGVSTLDDIDPNNIIGPTWSFDSIASVPTVTGDPVGVLVPSGGTAEYSVTADSISTPHYTWYKSDDKANDTPGDDTSVGSDSAALTLNSVAVADEGFYYCVISNDSAGTDTSAVAFLEVERLMAWYKFEDDLTDSSGNGLDGTDVPDANIPFAYDASGIVNKSLILDGTEAVEIPRSIQNSMTIELWVKTTATGSVGNGWFDGIGLVDGEIGEWDHDDFGTSLRGDSFAFGVGNNDTAHLTVQASTAINDNEWHYCVATRDHVTGQIAVYVDGSQQDSGVAPLGTKDEPSNLRIGSLLTAVNYFTGQLDEVKLANYPLTELEVAANYNTITGESACIESQRPDGKYDLNGDCVVDLVDFAEVAGAWLDCGLYSDCIP